MADPIRVLVVDDDVSHAEMVVQFLRLTEAWADGRPSPLFNHLSSGPQVCAGIDLLLFIAKAVIATILAGGRYRLERPPLDPARPLPYAYNYFDLRLLAG